MSKTKLRHTWAEIVVFFWLWFGIDFGWIRFKLHIPCIQDQDRSTCDACGTLSIYTLIKTFRAHYQCVKKPAYVRIQISALVSLFSWMYVIRNVMPHFVSPFGLAWMDLFLRNCVTDQHPTSNMVQALPGWKYDGLRDPEDRHGRVASVDCFTQAASRQDMSDDSEELPRPRSKPPGCPRFLDGIMGIGGQGGVGDDLGWFLVIR